MNIVTKSGTNSVHGEGAVHASSRRLAGEDVLDRRLLPAVGRDLRRRRRRSTAINPGGRSRRAQSGTPARSAGRSSRTGRSSSPPPTTRGRIGRRFCRPTLPAFVLPADGNLAYTGHYRQGCSTGGVDHKLTPSQTLMLRDERRSVLRHQPERRGRRHERAERRAAIHARRSDRPGQRHCVDHRPEPRQRGAHRVSGRRSGHALGSADALDDLHARRHRCRSRSGSRASPTSSAGRRSSPTRCRGRAASTPCASAAASPVTPPAAPAASPAPPCSARSRS